MPIFRWLIICLAVWLVVAILRRLIEAQRQKPSSNNSSHATHYKAVVACHHCDLHIPKTEALHKNGRYYCSSECHIE